MQLKKLFTVATGEKVTERKFHRVLISSVCSMVLCMACLVSTTWAWFAVSIDNQENIIQVAQWRLDVSVLAKTEEETSPVQHKDGIYTLEEGVYDIKIQFFSDAQGNDLDRATVYLIMVENIGETETKYAAVSVMNDDGDYAPIQRTYEVGEGKQAKLSFYFARMNPQINNDLMTAVFEAQEQEITPETTASNEENTDTDEESTGTDEESADTNEESADTNEESTGTDEENTGTDEENTGTDEESTDTNEESTGTNEGESQ